MKEEKVKSRTKDFEQALKRAQAQKYVLRLYVSGTTPKSMQAITTIKKICEEHLKGRYELEVIDIYQQPVLAKGEQIIAAPTLIKKLPLPLRRFIGNLTDSDKIIMGLDLKAKPPGGQRGKSTEGASRPDGREDNEKT